MNTSATGTTQSRRVAGPLKPGEPFGTRYHIIRLLGVGGMGAVYHAWDDELGVAVAIKTIRPEVIGDAESAEELERRFKRELLLARQVTHPNVVRIHDLGETDGIKYVTMPFIDGQDLASILSKAGRLPVARALAMFRQVVAGMQAAHAAGVIHRDLKPANIMISDHQVLIMDFGIARSVAASTMKTMAGGVVGTLEYMAPEQAGGTTVDQRADIYAMGLILHDLLVGRAGRPRTDNPVGDLMVRLQSPPPSVRSIDPTIPEALDRIVTRCLQIDPDLRFQTTTELVAAIDALDDSGLPRRASPVHTVRPSRRWPARIAVVGLVAAVAAGAWWAARFTGAPETPASIEPIPVLVANFDNRTGDAVFDGVLEQALTLGVEGSTFITAYPRATALRVANEIAPGQPLDEERARLVSVREGIRLVLLGSIESSDSGYRIAVRGVDAATGNVVAEAAEQANDKGTLLEAVANLASDLREDLGDAGAQAGGDGTETYTAASLEAANAYVRAQDLAAAGRFADAITLYQEALQRDPNFGRAYAGWATAAYRIGRPDEAESLFKKALTLMERMTEREKYRTLGAYYMASGNDEQAIANYTALLQRYPADGTGINNLAVAYFNTLDFRRAMEEGRKVVAMYPANVGYRTNLALYSMYASDFDAAVVESNEALKRGALDKTHLPLAVAALAAGRRDDAERAYRNMSKVGARGASIGSMGLADLFIYTGRDSDARNELERGAAADQIGNQRAPRAMKLVLLAELAFASGDRTRALSLVDEALALASSDGAVVPAARLLVALGRDDQAKRLAASLEKQIQKRRRAYAGVVRAELALRSAKPVEAIDALTSARTLADVWLVRYTLGRAYVESGHFAEALAELEACSQRSGEGAAVFLDDWPTYRYTVPVHYWMARAQQGLGLAASAAKSYETYLSLRGHVEGDELAADARRRAQAITP